MARVRFWPLLRERGIVQIFAGSKEEDRYYISLRQSGEMLVSPYGETHTRGPAGERGERHTRLFPGSTVLPKPLRK